MVIVYASWAFTLALMFIGAIVTPIPLFYWLCFWAFFWIGLTLTFKAFDYYEKKYWEKQFEKYWCYYLNLD